MIPGFSLHSCENTTSPLKPQSAVAGKRGKRIHAAILEFWFSFKCFLTPHPDIGEEGPYFPHAVEVSSKERSHPRTESKDGDSAGLHFSTAYLRVRSQQFFQFKNS